MSVEARYAFIWAAWNQLGGSFTASPGPEQSATYLSDTVKQYSGHRSYALKLAKAAGSQRYIKDGTTPVHWCGVFAVWCLRQATGLPIYWDITKEPRIRGPGVKYHAGRQPQLGDIGYIAGPENKRRHHHFVCIQSKPGELHSVDGNIIVGDKYNCLSYKMYGKVDGSYTLFGDE